MNSRPNPYVGPRSFQYGEALYARETESRALIDLLIAERIVLLHSPSGAGKSSMINAAIRPGLEQEGFTVLPSIRLNYQPSAREAAQLPAGVNRFLLSLLVSLEEPLPADRQMPVAALADMPLDDYLHRRRIDASDGEAAEGEVLIFDQFEEVVTRDPLNLEARREFFAELGAALRDRSRWALFAVREDFVAALAPYARLLPTRLANTFRLDLLAIDGAREAIQRPAKDRGVEFTAAAADKLVDDLRRVTVQQPDGSTEEQLGPYIEPVQLQVVCHRLWQNLADEAMRVDVADVEAVGDVDAALAGYYAESVAAAARGSGVGERRIRDWIEAELITDQGMRGQVLHSRDNSQGLENTAIDRLVDAHLIRAEKRRGATWFELAHDRLLAPIRRDNASWRQLHLSTLQLQAPVWDRANRPTDLLITGTGLEQAETWAADHERELSPLDRDYLAACREARDAQRRAEEVRSLRVRLALLTVAVLAVIAVSLGGLYYSAQKAQSISDAARARAEQQTLHARSFYLAGQALRHAADHTDLALLLGLEARRLCEAVEVPGGEDDCIPESLNALRGALQTEPRLACFLYRSSKTIRAMRFVGGRAALALEDRGVPSFTWIDGQDGHAVSDEVPITGMEHVSAMAISGDGAVIAMGDQDGEIALWTPGSPSSRRIEGARGSRVLALGFSERGDLLAAGDASGTVRVWSTEPGSREVMTLEGGFDAVYSVAFSSDGSTLAAGVRRGSEDAVVLWDTPTRGPRTRPLATTHGRVSSLVFGPASGTLAVGHWDGTVQLLRADLAAELEPPISVNRGPVTGMAFNPEAGQLASGSLIGRILLWNFASIGLDGNEGGLTDHQRFLRRNMQVLVSALYETSPARPTGDWPADVTDVLLDPRGHIVALVAGASSDTVRLWDVEHHRPIGGPLIHADRVRQLAFSQDGALLATVDGEGTVRLWDARTGVARARFGGRPEEGPPLNPRSLAVNARGDRIAMGYETGRIDLWDTRGGDPVRMMMDGETVSALAFSPDGSLLASGGTEGGLELWQVGTPGPAGARASIVGQASGTGRSDASAGTATGSRSGGGSTTVGTSAAPGGSDTATAAAVGSRLLAHRGGISAIAFSPDGALLATGSGDRTIRLWDVQRRTPLGIPLEGHGQAVTRLLFNDGGSRLLLASSSEDRTMRLWDVRAQRGIGSPLGGRGRKAPAIAFDPDEDTLLLVNVEGMLGRADLSVSEWERKACEIATRNLTAEEWQHYVGDLLPHRKTCPAYPLIEAPSAPPPTLASGEPP